MRPYCVSRVLIPADMAVANADSAVLFERTMKYDETKCSPLKVAVIVFDLRHDGDCGWSCPDAMINPSATAVNTSVNEWCAFGNCAFIVSDTIGNKLEPPT